MSRWERDWLKIKWADGIMVARGDLGVEIPVEDVPIAQKSIVKKCNAAGKPVIVATQMLDSMIHNPRPIRAESNDVANAIYESADAIMLSGETAIGGYPLETLQTMARIAQAVENSIDYVAETRTRQNMSDMSVTNAISSASCTIAINLDATAILTPTKSGYTASKISKYRPPCDSIALLFDSRIFNKLSLIWGVTPLLTEPTQSLEEFLEHSIQTALNSGMVKTGDTVVIAAGGSLNVSRTTDLIKVLKLE
ncbi:MAG: pyruvate kinase [Saccharofermentanales bacterium]